MKRNPSDLLHQTREERLLNEVMMMVEELGADTKLTDAVAFIDNARVSLSAWIDENHKKRATTCLKFTPED